MQHFRRLSRTVAAMAGTGLAVTLTGCGGATDQGSGEEGPITLTVATFNDFGYTEELFAKYTEEHPNITVKAIDAASADDARTNLVTKLAAGGEGLADVEAVEVDWISELAQYPELFTDLSDPELEGRWADWKVAQATTADGKLIGYGTDIGPEAICYRQDLLADAGLPSEPEKVAEWLGGADATWEEYFAAGRKFVKKSDSAWYDSGVATYQGMVNQVEFAYENEDGTAKDLADNATIKRLYDTIVEQNEAGLSARLVQWSEDWATAFQKDAFATMLCPAWMTGTIEQNSGGVDGWNVADVFPGGGGNWGGSFLTVPASGDHVEEAKALARWLTAPEQQISAFEEAGNFPSQLEAQSSDQVQSFRNEFMNDAPVGKIFSHRAQAIEGNPFKGPHYFAIHQAVQLGIERVETTGEDPGASWAKTVASFESLGLG